MSNKVIQENDKDAIAQDNVFIEDLKHPIQSPASQVNKPDQGDYTPERNDDPGSEGGPVATPAPAQSSVPPDLISDQPAGHPRAEPSSPGVGGGFSHIIGRMNEPVESAIKTLDHLNEQIIQYICSPKFPDYGLEHELSAKDRETLKTSMVLMRRLLVDAQTKFRKMVDDNQRLASRIDGSIQAANQEVNILRAELVETNRRLSQIGDQEVTTGADLNEAAGASAPCDEVVELERVRRENEQLRTDIGALHAQLSRMQEEHSQQLASKTAEDMKVNDWKLEFIQIKQELTRAKEALQAMKSDRKRLKAEKVELLSQMKQVYCTLEDKEGELRDFIRNYEQRMRDSELAIKQLAEEKERSEQEKWSVLKKASQATERCVSLTTELEKKDELIAQLEAQIAERDSCGGVSTKPSESVSSDSLVKCSPPPPGGRSSSSPSGDELPPYQEVAGSPNDSKVLLSNSINAMNVTNRLSNLSNSIQDLKPPVNNSTLSLEEHNISTKGRKMSLSEKSEDKADSGVYVTLHNEMRSMQRKKSFSKNGSMKSPGTFSKLFGKSRTRQSVAVMDTQKFEEHLEACTPRVSMLTQDNYQEKLSTVAASSKLSVTKWKACHVLAWLEIDMNMPMYGQVCAENIKSGKVLLGLSDAELDSALGLTSVLHRRKLRLAIEEKRDPSIVKFPKAALLDPTWLSHRWLSDLGLALYSGNFHAELVDGRLLNVLTRKDLEKYLGVHRKFHQVSILHGIELLRRLSFDKELLMKRRSECENDDTDPIVWTFARVVKWLQSIDLHEYVVNVMESGIHGALLVLEPTFTADVFAAALGIPPTKSYVRRHLATELDILVSPARSSLDSLPSKVQQKRSASSSSLGRSFTRSYRGGSSPDTGGDTGGLRGSAGKKISFRGSLGRAFSKSKSRLEIGSPVLQDASKDNSNGKINNFLTVDNPLDASKRSNSDNIPTTASTLV